MNKDRTKTMHFQTIFRSEPEGGFTVLVPSLPGCVTYGKTLNQARKMAREAVSLYVEDLIAEGDPIPESDRSYISDVEVTLSNNSRPLVYA